jgi:molybdopterin/thiamine biosynthesis adenylyltransferase
MGGRSLVSGRDHVRARVWFPDESNEPIARVRVIGERYRLFASDEFQQAASNPIFDRQVRAFGPDIQRVLSSLHVGVVGAGGIGSCTIEQLVRVGVGEISVWDDDEFDPSNANRVYGSRVNDAWRQKVDIVERETRRKGLATRLHTHPAKIARVESARALRDCDIVFGCTDDNYGRSILNRLSLWYYIPVIDTAVAFDSALGRIRSITGRVTVLQPGNACLRCRGRITQSAINAESIVYSDPKEYERLRKIGYVQELGAIAPAVISFTTAVSSLAINEFLHRLTGFRGESSATEFLFLFDEAEIRANCRPPDPNCYCSSTKFWGKGDEEDRFLGVLWDS